MTLSREQPYFGYFLLIILSVIVFFQIKSCSEENTSHARFDPTTAARMFPALSNIDTTKPQIKTKPIISTHYTLSGSDTLFNWLWIQINSPMDVTPRQLNSLKEWVQRNLKQDTLTNK